MPVSTEAAGPGRVVGEEAPHELGAGHACTVREGVGVVGLEEQQALRQAPLARHRLRVATVMTPASAHNIRIRALASWRTTQWLHIPCGGGCVGKVDRVCSLFHLSSVPALIWFRLWPAGPALRIGRCRQIQQSKSLSIPNTCDNRNYRPSFLLQALRAPAPHCHTDPGWRLFLLVVTTQMPVPPWSRTQCASVPAPVRSHGCNLYFVYLGFSIVELGSAMSITGRRTMPSES